MVERFWLETLGCPKNQVDSDKLAGTLTLEGFEPADTPEDADLVVVNTCAFIEAARQESIDTILELSDARRDGARLVVTGCMAERYGDELAASLPEVDLVAPFGVPLHPPGGRIVPEAPTAPDTRAVPVSLTSKPPRVTSAPTGPTSAPLPRVTSVPPSSIGPVSPPLPSFDLLNLPRPRATAPWAYIKVAEGCDRNCGFCAIPSFRGKQRSRSTRSILEEADQLGAAAGTLQEVVLVAQDLSSFALDRSTRHSAPRTGLDIDGADIDRPAAGGNRPIVDLVAAMSERVAWTRLLYLYPSTLDDALVEAVLATGVPYFDLSLQHVSRPLLKRMRRWGEGDRFLERIASIRRAEPKSAFRSSFIIGYPGETESDHDQLLAWIEEAQLDWVGFFPFSNEEGTFAAGLEDQVPDSLVAERLRECTSLQDAITAHRRDELIGTRVEVLIDAPGEGRTYREAPEIDGIVVVPEGLPVGSFVDVIVTGADGPDLVAEPASHEHLAEPASHEHLAEPASHEHLAEPASHEHLAEPASHEHRAGALR